MCGRFTLRTPLGVLIAQFEVELTAEQRQQLLFEPRYNIAPTQDVLAVRRAVDAGGRELATLRWGLVPGWAKDPVSGPPLINARVETLAEKPAFREAFRQRRCLIPADGFYEWKQLSGRKKQPFYIRRADHQPFAFAGLWERWSGGPVIESCTVITKSANDALSSLHDRMPVVLTPSDYDSWLDAVDDDSPALQEMLARDANDELVAEPVSPHVNRVANDDPRCIAPVAEQEGERMLF